MPTWTVQFTADPEITGAANANLSGTATFDESSKPGDFTSGATVTSVRIQYQVTGAGFVDDTWDLGTAAVQLRDSVGGGLAAITPAASTDNQNVTQTVDLTDNAPTASAGNYQNELTLEASGGGAYTFATYVQDMKADDANMVLEGGAAESFAVITYTTAVAATVYPPWPRHQGQVQSNRQITQTRM